MKSKIEECGSLKEKWPKGNSIIRWCHFVGVNMAFLEEVCHYRGRIEVSYAHDMAQHLSELPVVCKI